MPMNVSDHEQLHDWVARSALAGAAASVLGLVLGHGSAGLSIGALVALIGIAIVSPRSIVDVASLSLLSVVSVAAMRLSPRVALPAVAMVIGLALARRLGSSRERAVAFLLGTSAALGALVIRRAFIETEPLVPVLGVGLSTLAAGAISGAVIGLGAIGRLAGRASPAVSPSPALELDRLAAEVHAANADVGSLLKRAAEAHREAAAVVGPLTGARAADDLVRRMVGFGQEWLEIERRAATTQPEALTERIALLQDRLDKTRDAVAAAELERAIAAIEAQKQALTEILAGRERAVARLEHQVATLERLRLAALRHRSADASRLQAELQPVLDELAEAGGDHDLASDALRDADASAVEVLLSSPTRAN